MKLVFHTAEDGSEIEKVKYWGEIIRQGTSLSDGCCVLV